MEITKNSLITGVAIVAMAVLGALIAGANPAASHGNPNGLPPGQQRVLLTPHNSNDSDAVKGRPDVDVQHEFGISFSANVPTVALPSLAIVADIEAVGVSELHKNDAATPSGKPQCGNGVAEGGEKCGEPGLSCSGEQICEACKCVDPGGSTPPPDRACYPSTQVAYNTSQVNGGSGGAGVNVAVLDSGVFSGHPDLDVQLCKDATKRGIKNGCNDRSSSGHGTHSAGIIAANGGDDGLGIYGVAPDANLWMVKVCGSQYCFNDDIAAAIDYVAGQGADIVNMSLGAGSESTLLRDAINAHPEILFIASAGNTGPGADTIEYPAANPNVVAVAANDVLMSVASFSSRGINDGNDLIISSREVELSAGGVAVESTNTDGCYSSLSGTSFSSPTVAGLAAKVWQGDAASTRAHLRSLAHDITSASGGGAGVGFDTASGYGLPVAP